MTDVQTPPEPTRSPEGSGIRVKSLAACTDESWCGQTRHVWVDVESPTPAQVEELERHFAFNRLALEDALETDHWSRFESYPEHLFLIFRTLAEPEGVTERTEEVDVFWFPKQNTLVTFRHEPIVYLDAVWNELNRFSERSPVDVLYTLLQRGTDTFFTFLDELENRTDALERRVFEGGADQAQPLYEEVFALKRVMTSARRLVSNARENVAGFSRHVSASSPEGAVYLRDVADHLTRVYDGLDSEREVLVSLLDVHLNVQNQRLNEVMRTLTTVSTIFLPLTFLAGVWGMNFQFQPEFGWRFGYPFAWASFILVAVGLVVYFKRRGWW